ncbi:hypothetical protein Tco_1381463, partial [Tanacetum coccineum]
KKPVKKSTIEPTTGVVIRDIPSESMLKKKTPAKVVRGKGMDLLSDVALLEAAQLWKLTSFMQVAQVMELVPYQRFLMSKKTRQLVQIKELVLNQGFPMYPNINLRVKMNLGEIVTT